MLKMAFKKTPPIFILGFILLLVVLASSIYFKKPVAVKAIAPEMLYLEQLGEIRLLFRFLRETTGIDRNLFDPGLAVLERQFEVGILNIRNSIVTVERLEAELPNVRNAEQARDLVNQSRVAAEQLRTARVQIADVFRAIFNGLNRQPTIATNVASQSIIQLQNKYVDLFRSIFSQLDLILARFKTLFSGPAAVAVGGSLAAAIESLQVFLSAELTGLTAAFSVITATVGVVVVVSLEAARQYYLYMDRLAQERGLSLEAKSSCETFPRVLWNDLCNAIGGTVDGVRGVKRAGVYGCVTDDDKNEVVWNAAPNILSVNTGLYLEILKGKFVNGQLDKDPMAPFYVNKDLTGEMQKACRRCEDAVRNLNGGRSPMPLLDVGRCTFIGSDISLQLPALQFSNIPPPAPPAP